MNTCRAASLIFRRTTFLTLLGLIAAPLAAGGDPVGYLVGVGGSGAARGLYLADLRQEPAVVSGPFLAGSFPTGSQVTVLRDAPAGILKAGNQLHRIDLSNPSAPAVTVSATLPFTINDLARVSAVRDELVAVGNGGELAVIDPATLGIRASFALPSQRRLVRPSPDGRLLLTQGFGQDAIFLAPFDPVLGVGSEATIDAGAASFREAAFSPNGRTVVLHDTFCWGSLLGPPFCDTYLIVYDLTDPANPIYTEDFNPGIDMVTSSVLDRSGERLYFHQRGSHKWGGSPPHRLLPFVIAGGGDLTAETPLALTEGGNFEASGVVRSAGAKELLVSASETTFSPTTTVSRLHRYTLATSAMAVSPLPVPLDPRGVVYPGSAVFADGFESGDTGAWGPADL